MASFTISDLQSWPVHTALEPMPAYASHYSSGDATINSGNSIFVDTNPAQNDWVNAWTSGGDQVANNIVFVENGSQAPGPVLKWIDVFLAPGSGICGLEFHLIGNGGQKIPFVFPASVIAGRTLYNDTKRQYDHAIYKLQVAEDDAINNVRAADQATLLANLEAARTLVTSITETLDAATKAAFIADEFQLRDKYHPLGAPVEPSCRIEPSKTLVSATPTEAERVSWEAWGKMMEGLRTVKPVWEMKNPGSPIIQILNVWRGNNLPYVRLLISGGANIESLRVNCTAVSDDSALNTEFYARGTNYINDVPAIQYVIAGTGPVPPLAVFTPGEDVGENYWKLDTNYVIVSDRGWTRRFSIPRQVNILPTLYTSFDYIFEYALFSGEGEMITRFTTMESISEWVHGTQNSYEAEKLASDGGWKAKLIELSLDVGIQLIVGKIIGTGLSKIMGAACKKQVVKGVKRGLMTKMKDFISNTREKMKGTYKVKVPYTAYERIMKKGYNQAKANWGVGKGLITKPLTGNALGNRPGPLDYQHLKTYYNNASGAANDFAVWAAETSRNIQTGLGFIENGATDNSLSELLPVGATGATGSATGAAASADPGAPLSAGLKAINYDPSTELLPEQWNTTLDNEMKYIFDTQKEALVELFNNTNGVALSSHDLTGWTIDPKDAFLSWQDFRQRHGYLWQMGPGPDFIQPRFSMCSVKPLTDFLRLRGGFWDGYVMVTRGKIDRWAANPVRGPFTHESVPDAFEIKGYNLEKAQWESLPDLENYNQATMGSVCNKKGVSFMTSPNVDNGYLYLGWHAALNPNFLKYASIRFQSSFGTFYLHPTPEGGNDDDANIARNVVTRTTVGTGADGSGFTLCLSNNYTCEMQYSHSWFYEEYFQYLDFSLKVVNNSVPKMSTTRSATTYTATFGTTTRYRLHATLTSITFQCLDPPTDVSSYASLFTDPPPRWSEDAFATFRILETIDTVTSAAMQQVVYHYDSKGVVSGYTAYAQYREWSADLPADGAFPSTRLYSSPSSETIPPFQMGVTPYVLRCRAHAVGATGRKDNSAFRILDDVTASIGHTNSSDLFSPEAFAHFIVNVPSTSYGFTGGVDIYFENLRTYPVLMFVCYPPSLQLSSRIMSADNTNWSNTFTLTTSDNSIQAKDCRLSIRTQGWWSSTGNFISPITTDRAGYNFSNIQYSCKAPAYNVTNAGWSSDLLTTVSDWSQFFPTGEQDVDFANGLYTILSTMQVVAGYNYTDARQNYSAQPMPNILVQYNMRIMPPKSTLSRLGVFNGRSLVIGSTMTVNPPPFTGATLQSTTRVYDFQCVYSGADRPGWRGRSTLVFTATCVDPLSTVDTTTFTFQASRIDSSLIKVSVGIPEEACLSNAVYSITWSSAAGGGSSGNAFIKLQINPKTTYTVTTSSSYVLAGALSRGTTGDQALFTIMANSPLKLGSTVFQETLLATTTGTSTLFPGLTLKYVNTFTNTASVPVSVNITSALLTSPSLLSFDVWAYDEQTFPKKTGTFRIKPVPALVPASSQTPRFAMVYKKLEQTYTQDINIFTYSGFSASTLTLYMLEDNTSFRTTSPYPVSYPTLPYTLRNNGIDYSYTVSTANGTVLAFLKACKSFAVWWYDSDTQARGVYRTYDFPMYEVTYRAPESELYLYYNTQTTVATFTCNEPGVSVIAATSLANANATPAVSLSQCIVRMTTAATASYTVTVEFSDAFYGTSANFGIYVRNEVTNSYVLLQLPSLIIAAPILLTSPPITVPISLEPISYFAYTTTLTFNKNVQGFAFLVYADTYSGASTPAGGLLTSTRIKNIVQSSPSSVTCTVYIASAESTRDDFTVWWMDKNTMPTYWGSFLVAPATKFTVANVITGVLTDLTRGVFTRVADLSTSSRVSAPIVVASPIWDDRLDIPSGAYTLALVPVGASGSSADPGLSSAIGVTGLCDYAVYIRPNVILTPWDIVLGKPAEVQNNWPVYIWTYDNSNSQHLTPAKYTHRYRSIMMPVYQSVNSGAAGGVNLYDNTTFPYISNTNPGTLNRANDWSCTYTGITCKYARDLNSLKFAAVGGEETLWQFQHPDAVASATNLCTLKSTLTNVVGTKMTLPYAPLNTLDVMSYTFDVTLHLEPENRQKLYSGFSFGGVYLANPSYGILYSSDDSSAGQYYKWQNYRNYASPTQITTPVYYSPFVNRIATQTIFSGLPNRTGSNPAVGGYPSANDPALASLSLAFPPSLADVQAFNTRQSALTFSVSGSSVSATFVPAFSSAATKSFDVYFWDDFTPIVCLTRGISVRFLSRINIPVFTSPLLLLRRGNNWSDPELAGINTYYGIDMETLLFTIRPTAGSLVTNLSGIITFTKSNPVYLTNANGVGTALFSLSISAPLVLQISGAIFELWWQDGNTAATLIRTYAIPQMSTFSATASQISIDASNFWKSDIVVNYMYAKDTTASHVFVKVLPASIAIVGAAARDTFFNTESDSGFTLQWQAAMGPVNTLRIVAKSPKTITGTYNLYIADDNSDITLLSTITTRMQYSLAYVNVDQATIAYAPVVPPATFNTGLQQLEVTGNRFSAEYTDALNFKALPETTVISSVTDLLSATALSGISASLIDQATLRVQVVPTLSVSFRIWALYSFGPTGIDVYLGDKVFTAVPNTTACFEGTPARMTLSIGNRWSVVQTLQYNGVNMSSLQIKVLKITEVTIPTCFTFATMTASTTTSLTITILEILTPTSLQTQFSCSDLESGGYNVWLFDGAADPVFLGTVQCVPSFPVTPRSGFPTLLDEAGRMACSGEIDIGSTHDASIDDLVWAAFPGTTLVTTANFQALGNLISGIRISWLLENLHTSGTLSVFMSRDDALQYSRLANTFSVVCLHTHRGVNARVLCEIMFTLNPPSKFMASNCEITFNALQSSLSSMLVYTGLAVDTLKFLAVLSTEVVTSANFLSLIPESINDSGIAVVMNPIDSTRFSLEITALFLNSRTCNLYVMDKCSSPFIVARISCNPQALIVLNTSDTFLHKSNNWAIRNTFTLYDYNHSYDTFVWKIFDSKFSIKEYSDFQAIPSLEFMSVSVDMEMCAYNIRVENLDLLTGLEQIVSLYCLHSISGTPVQLYMLCVYTIINRSTFSFSPMNTRVNIGGSQSIMNISINSQSPETVRFILKPKQVDIIPLSPA